MLDNGVIAWQVYLLGESRMIPQTDWKPVMTGEGFVLCGGVRVNLVEKPRKNGHMRLHVNIRLSGPVNMFD